MAHPVYLNVRLTPSKASVVFSNTMKREIKDRKCPRCGGEALVRDRKIGEVVCGECGYVVTEGLIERGPKLGGMKPEEEPRKRVGRVSPETRRKMRRLMRYDQRVRSEAEEKRTVRPALNELDRLIQELHLPWIVRDRAAEIYRKAQEKDIIVRGTMAGFAAASVYTACRENEIPRTLHQVSEVSTEDVKEISRSYRILITELDLKIPVDEPMKLVPRIAHEAKLSRGTELLSVKILREGMRQKALSGKDPRGLAAAALYMACKTQGEECTQGELANIAGVSGVTLRKRLRDLEEVVEARDGVRVFLRSINQGASSSSTFTLVLLSLLLWALMFALMFYI